MPGCNIKFKVGGMPSLPEQHIKNCFLNNLIVNKCTFDFFLAFDNTRMHIISFIFNLHPPLYDQVMNGVYRSKDRGPGEKILFKMMYDLLRKTPDVLKKYPEAKLEKWAKYNVGVRGYV